MPRPYPEALFHATPLHGVPYLLRTGTLYSQSTIRNLGLPLAPRRTVARRDRKLRLDGNVHLALTPVTPLLRDKLVKGYPHVLLRFDASLLQRPEAALLLWNPKSWRHREDFAPVTDPAEKERVMAEWQAGRYPSAEVLIPDELSVAEECRCWHFATGAERDWLLGLCVATGMAPPVPAEISPDYFLDAASFDWEPFHRYAAQCLAAGEILPPPDLPFD